MMKIPLAKLSTTERRTYVLDSTRGAVDGVLLSLEQSVFLLVAIQFFAVADIYTSLITSSRFIGLFMTVFLPSLFGRRGWTKSFLVGTNTLLAGCFLILSATDEVFFVPGIVLHLILIAVRTPLLTAIYEENYAKNRRGRLYSTGVMLSIICGLATGFISANLLEKDITLYRILFIFIGLLTIISGLLFLKVPSDKLRENNHPLKDLKLLVRNKLFGLMSLSWSIVGFANLWSLPLRVVHLADPERGLNFSPFLVILVLSIFPNLIRILLNYYWAGHFDRHHFLRMRITLNVFIAGGILIFFLGKTLIAVSIGSIIMSIGFAGGAYLWNLWVMKIAPPGETQHYMTAHTFLAGLRGMVSPFLGVFAAQIVNLQGIGIISFGIMFAGSLVLLPSLKALEALEKT